MWTGATTTRSTVGACCGNADGGEPDDAADGTTDDDGTATTATKRDAATEVLRKGHHDGEKMGGLREDSVVSGAADNRFGRVRRLGRGKSGFDGEEKDNDDEEKQQRSTTRTISSRGSVVSTARKSSQRKLSLIHI